MDFLRCLLIYVFESIISIIAVWILTIFLYVKCEHFIMTILIDSMVILNMLSKYKWSYYFLLVGFLVIMLTFVYTVFRYPDLYDIGSSMSTLSHVFLLHKILKESFIFGVFFFWGHLVYYTEKSSKKRVYLFLLSIFGIMNF